MNGILHNISTDTIAAISTAMGSAGIGIIKVSGPLAINSTLSLFRQKNYTVLPEKKIISHKMIHGWMLDPDHDTMIDEVLWVCMKKPHSYTGEDVAEIHTHGSHVVLQSILEQILNTPNVRLAKPGEFTRRAYMNGRIDLTHAEAVMDVISAQTQQTLTLTSAHLTGQLKKTIESMRDQMIQWLATIEASIDFPDDMSDEQDPSDIQASLTSLIDQINHYIADYHQTAIYRDGAKVVIVGRPNVGKSSLLNCLLAKDRAIVSNQPGTTRDVIDGQVNIANVPMTLFDTAGIHISFDNIEQQGISRAKALIQQAHLILLVIEAGKELTQNDFQIYDEIGNGKMIVCANKIDQVQHQNTIHLPEHWPQPINISAKYHMGIDQLKQTIATMVTGNKDNMPSPEFMINLRQKNCLETSKECLEQALSACVNNMPLDCATIDISLALDALGEMIGVVHNEQMLDQIFSSFCIGK
ncbi:MAG: tRNA uridine-5-carboxymethylaminomethyl(34) synthesis GTPase MnmE [Candidatus Magnetomorum sp.]|nr:tRNA uridine-5-carboxymethylaminomethyl(34) synthesis GTPase MnmE [Candidatus Magnetomorum sp.]